MYLCILIDTSPDPPGRNRTAEFPIRYETAKPRCQYPIIHKNINPNL